MSEPGHGSVGTREANFTTLLPPRKPGHYKADTLLALSEKMKAAVDTVNDGPDPEENILLPAGYTYFGQFVDHDLTFDSTSSLNPKDAAEVEAGTRMPTNLRTPRFDLDSIYGDGPAAQPFMYAADGATLLFGGSGAVEPRIDANGKLVQGTTDWDLLRAPNGRAIIGDKRNDENSIVCQIQLGFIKFHNLVVARLSTMEPEKWNTPNNLFQSARNEVTWTYQKLLVTDFLPRLIKADVLRDLAGKTPAERKNSYALYKGEKRRNVPREFVAAAYRYGHSGVRTGYRLNGTAGAVNGTKLSIFPPSDSTDQAVESLIGFEPLPFSHVIDDWQRFFAHTPPLTLPTENRMAKQKDDGVVRLQFAYKLDPTIVDPLGVLPATVAGTATIAQTIEVIKPKKMPDPSRPSLALLNLLRGNIYGLPSGQQVARALKKKFPRVSPLDPKYLCIRVPIAPDGHFKFERIDASLLDDTPLWFYVLAEAQKEVFDAIPAAQRTNFDEDLLLVGAAAKTQLGWVGGRIVGEVFYGLLDSDKDSIFNLGKNWKSVFGAKSPKTVLDLLEMSRTL